MTLRPVAVLGLCLALLPAAAAAHDPVPAGPQGPGASARPGAAAAAPATAAADGLRADLALFRTRFLAVDRSYAPAARAEAEARLAALEAALERVSPAYFELELARIVALADNGHTACFPGPRSRRYDRVGIRLVPFGEEYYVLRARAEHADLLGARLVAVGAHPVAELRPVARSLLGGTPAWRDRNAGFFFESPEQMHALGLLEAPGAAGYRFALADGREVVRRLVASPADPARPRANSDRMLYPAALDGEGDDWRPLLPVERAPWALADPAERFRWREAPELDAVVIELRQNHGTDAHPIRPFLDDMTRVLLDRKPRHLVLDMRMNGGGDLNTTREFMRSLPSLVPGRIFVLIGPWTFSAAISSVGYLEQEAPERVTLVGEGVGDRLRMWAEGRPLTLPNSGAVVLSATERHDYRTGCRGFDDCHGSVVRHPIAVPDLDPDLVAPWTIEAYRDGRDPAMAAVAEALRSGG